MGLYGRPPLALAGFLVRLDVPFRHNTKRHRQTDDTVYQRLNR